MEISRFNKQKDVMFLSENLKIFAELVLCFFACIGVVYVTHDVIEFIFKRKKKTHAAVIIDLSESLYPIREILDFAVFYHSSHAERYIERIIITGVSDSIKESETELIEVLRIPIEFTERK